MYFWSWSLGNKMTAGLVQLPGCWTQGFNSSLITEWFSLRPGDSKINLRTVHTIVIAHTFCASRDTRICYRRCLLMMRYFCAVQNHAEKTELGKCFWYPKRKLGVTMQFSEIIKLQFGKERHTLLCILQILINYLRKMHGYP